jgi:ATP-dependent protease ClpP protease subunit
MLAAGLLVLWPISAAAQAPTTPVRVIEVKGSIRPDLVPQLRSALETADPERYPAGAVLFLDSPGGDGLAAIEAGRLIRTARAHVFVRGRCSSACVFLLAAGVVRGAADLSVGIHRPRLTTFVKGIGVVDINPNSNPNAAKALEISDRRSEEYLREMGLPDTLFKAMLATPSDQVRKLTSAELAEFGLTGVDPGYAEMRAPGAAARYGIARDAFSLRAPHVQQKCVTDGVVAQDFVRCYSRVLRTGE